MTELLTTIEKAQHNEIKRRAWEIYKDFVVDPRYKINNWSVTECFNDAWLFAKSFYELAKKEETIC